jgi:hypothetical protein
MKKLFLIAALVAAGITINAQTNAPVAAQNAPTSFFQSLQGYLTSFNTDYTWTNVTFEASTGYKQVTGKPAASTIELQYDMGRWNAGVALQYFGIGSDVNAIEAQAGYAIIQHFDTKIEVDLRGGYDTVRQSGLIEPCLFLEKKTSANTYVKTGCSMPVYFTGKFQQDFTLFVEMGFSL